MVERRGETPETGGGVEGGGAVTKTPVKDVSKDKISEK